MLQTLPEIRTPMAGLSIFILIIVFAAFVGFIKNDGFKERLYTLLFHIMLPVFLCGWVYFAFSDIFNNADTSLIDRFSKGNISKFSTYRRDQIFEDEKQPMILDDTSFQNCEFKNMKLRFKGTGTSIHLGSKFSNVTMEFEKTDRVSILMQPQQAVESLAK